MKTQNNLTENSKSLEERIFNIRDWIPIYGAVHMFKRRNKMSDNNRYSLVSRFYVCSHSIYTGGYLFGLYKIYESLK